jgi:hypothetical protein
MLSSSGSSSSATRAPSTRRNALVGVHGDARDVDVAVDVPAQRVDGKADDARDERGDVDHGVPVGASKSLEGLSAVAADLLRLGEELRVRAAAVEQRQLVSALERVFDQNAAEEARAAEDQQLHDASAWSRRSTSSGVL